MIIFWVGALPLYPCFYNTITDDGLTEIWGTSYCSSTAQQNAAGYAPNRTQYQVPVAYRYDRRSLRVIFVAHRSSPITEDKN